MIGAYRDAGGRGDADLQVHLSWAPTSDEAEAIAHDQWRSNVFAPPVCWDVDTASDVRRGRERRPARAGQREVVNVSSDLGAHTALARRVRRAGVRQDLRCTTSARSRTAFIDAFGEKVLPELGGTAA